MDNSVNDEELMLAYRGGDVRAFETLYQRHKHGLYRYLVRQCRVAAIAEELFQNVWTSLIRARERYEPRARFAAYLYCLAHNQLIDHYRRQANGVPVSYDDPAQTPLENMADGALREPTDELGARRQTSRLMELLEKLPEAQREAFLLREESGLSLEEIADATDVNIETVKSRLRYAVAKLRKGMRAPTARQKRAEP